jgi:cyclase
MRSGNTMRRSFTNAVTCWTVAAAFGLVVCSAVSIQAAEPDTGGLDVVKVRQNFYMIAGAGGNIGVQIGSDGVMLVNSGNAASSTEVLAAIKKLTDLQIRYIINTGAGPDFVGGNAKLAKSGLNVLNGQTGAAILSAR